MMLQSWQTVLIEYNFMDYSLSKDKVIGISIRVQVLQSLCIQQSF